MAVEGSDSDFAVAEDASQKAGDDRGICDGRYFGWRSADDSSRSLVLAEVHDCMTPLRSFAGSQDDAMLRLFSNTSPDHGVASPTGSTARDAAGAIAFDNAHTCSRFTAD